MYRGTITEILKKELGMSIHYSGYTSDLFLTDSPEKDGYKYGIQNWARGSGNKSFSIVRSGAGVFSPDENTEKFNVEGSATDSIEEVILFYRKLFRSSIIDKLLK